MVWPLGDICTRRYFCSEHTRTVLILTLKMAPKESKPIGHRNRRNTSPSYKHGTIKWGGHVEMSEREHRTFAN